MVADAKGRPIRMFLSAGHRSDYVGALAMLSSLPQAKVLLADRGYDADWFREALADRSSVPCIPSRRNRKVAVPHDLIACRPRHRIENAFAGLKDWRRVATRLTIAALTLTSVPSPSPLLSCSGYET